MTERQYKNKYLYYTDLNFGDSVNKNNQFNAHL